jgi:hypothetical protein
LLATIQIWDSTIKNKNMLDRFFLIIYADSRNIYTIIGSRFPRSYRNLHGCTGDWWKAADGEVGVEAVSKYRTRY